ncbi:hypothetical protein JG688_00007289 [Phytophthora aleatoria]|uniref:Uncharacterized protein n=1 Tax=Phytophthora aleatoria TaxID=2496075 RepID=A0A8J5M619_9STRA|nr:hypothetical protein JG688_00007289 [Phytophthora aleatoria]
MTAELKRDGLFNKMLHDSQRSLQLELEMIQFRLHNDAEAERVEIRQKITNLETKRAEMNEKDQGHSIRIEEIDATGGGGANAEVKHLHEERRTLKQARQALKADMKAVAAQLAELNQQMRGVSDKEKASLLRISSDESEDQEEDESSAVYCRVRAEVLPLAKAVVFEVWDPYDRQQWRIAYPESHELLREFEVETFVEQQMHLEAITMSLLLYPNAETGRLELRFEE